jgi:hypothetical protein
MSVLNIRNDLGINHPRHDQHSQASIHTSLYTYILTMA